MNCIQIISSFTKLKAEKQQISCEIRNCKFDNFVKSPKISNFQI